MNVSTSTLLNILAPKLDNNLKNKIDNLSNDGKINLDLIVKDKSIQSLLTDMFKDISSGTKTKQDVLNLIQNQSQTLSFKNLTQDIKTLLKFVQNDPTLSTKLSSGIEALKESLIDLKKLDSTQLKNNISNSGVFLESKLLQQSIPISKNISQAIALLTNQLNASSKNSEVNLNLIQKQIDQTLLKQDIPKDIKLEIKNGIENILKDIKNLLQNPISQSNILKDTQTTQQTNQIKQSILPPNIEQAIKNLSTKLESLNIKSEIINNIKDLFIKELPIENKNNLLSLVQQQTNQIISKPNIPNDIKLEIKNAIENLLRQIPNNQAPTKEAPQAQAQQLQQKGLNTNISNLLANQQATTPNQQTITSNQFQSLANQLNSSMFENIEVNIKDLDQKLNNLNIKSEVLTNIKDLFLNVKDQALLKNNMNVLRTLLTFIDQKLDSSNMDMGSKTNIKEQINNLNNQLKSFDLLKAPNQQLPQLQNLLSNLKTFQSGIENLNINQNSQQNSAISKNLSSDLKGVILQVQEQIDNAKEPVSKEIRATVDKISSQVEFYQLLSYTSNSNHTYVSFLQDEIEDADVQFNKTKDDTFSCQINLSLKNHRDLKVLLVLDNKNNLGINIGIENEDFKQKVQENLQKLRLGINDIGLLLQSLNIFSIDDKNVNKKTNNPYGMNNEIDFGLDIKA